MIDMTLAYNAILGRPLPHQINVVINTRFLALKFPTQHGVATLRGD
jgi:transcriptional regulator CtsR